MCLSICTRPSVSVIQCVCLSVCLFMCVHVCLSVSLLAMIALSIVQSSTRTQYYFVWEAIFGDNS